MDLRGGRLTLGGSPASLLAAETGAGVRPNSVVVVVALAVAIVVVIGVLVAALVTRPRQPDDAPAAMEPPDEHESPALVDLLTGDFEVSDEAAPATVLHLAARGWLTVESHGDDTQLLRLSRRDGKGDLGPFERRVLDHLRSLAVDGVVAAGAITTGTEKRSASWWRGFRSEVVAAARERGLCRRRWPRQVGLSVIAGSFLVGILLWASVQFTDPERIQATPAWSVGLVAAIVIFVLGGRLAGSTAERDTDAGRVEAARWLGLRRWLVDHGDFGDAPASSVAIWDAYLGWAAAMGLAPTAVRSLPLGAEDDHRAWSSAGGRWRRVRVRYPRTRPGWGRYPLAAMALGLIGGAMAVIAFRFFLSLRDDDFSSLGKLSETQIDWAHRSATILALLCLIPLTWSVVQLVCGAVDLFARRALTGVIVRARVRPRLMPMVPVFGRWILTRGGAQKDERNYWFLGCDDGSGPSVVAWSVNRRVYDSVDQGDTARATVTRLLGHVAAIESLEKRTSPPSAAEGPSAPTGAADQAMLDAAKWLTEKLAR